MRRWLTDDEGRLRITWRLLVFGALVIVLQTAVVLPAVAIFGPQLLQDGGLGITSPGLVVTQGLGIIAMTLAVFIARRWLDRRSFASLGLQLRSHWLQHLLWGMVLGIGLQAFIFLTELAAGWLVIEDVGWRGTNSAPFGLLLFALVFAAVAWNEELLTRGYLLQNLESGLGTIAAVTISSLLFGLLHIFNANASIIATLGVAFAGLLLAAAYLVTRSLWLPIGLHLGWNYGEGPIFGFPVSGLDAGGLVTHRVTGPELITGGAFGPEAGLISVAAEIVGIALLGIYFRRSRNRSTAEGTEQKDFRTLKPT
ncbi:MAG: lysostaphin resistance A-like protein [Chloroflexota bacterium]